MPVAPVKGRSRIKVPRLPPIKTERLKAAKELVQNAVKQGKVFTVVGPYPVIRAGLWARGWVERHLPSSEQKAAQCPNYEMDFGDESGISADREDDGSKEKLDDMYSYMSHLVRKETTHFYWTSRLADIDCHPLRSDQIINHYANAGTFATKVGLCMNLRNLCWFDSADPNTFFPRCYRLGVEEEKQAFKEDFRRTACTSLLKHVVETRRYRKDGGDDEVQDSKNNVSGDICNAKHQFVDAGVIDMALGVCQQFLNALECRDNDLSVETRREVAEQQWAEFLQDYYKVTHEGASIRGSGVFVERCRAMLIKLWEVCPQLDTDGLNNIWIIKPGAMSRGRGIMCKDRLEEILAVVDEDRSLAKESKWVVQKYLERPLLVHGTKFDVRQWFLVTDWKPLTIWFYKEGYLRFSTQLYSTENLDGSVHLCNNAIQKHFEPAHDRHPSVPKDNMWSYSQFQAFLQQQGRGAEWDSVTIPHMQKVIVHALQTAQKQVQARKASFELYGADFMLGRNLRPWLLEINVCPTMAHSSAVTARLCPAVQIDTLRVVLDRRADRTAYTGGFQLIYRRDTFEAPLSVRLNLIVKGALLKPPRPCRQTIVSKTPGTIQSQSDLPLQQVKKSQRSSNQEPPKVSASCHSAKERKSKKKRKKKNRQLTSTSSHRDPRGRSGVQPLVVHTQSKRNAKRLAPVAPKETLIPKSLSISLNPLHSIEHQTPDHNSVFSRSIPAQTAFLHRNKTSAQICPPLRLPKLEVSQPYTVTGMALACGPAALQHPQASAVPLFLRKVQGGTEIPAVYEIAIPKSKLC